MIDHVWSVLCSRSVIDRDTNNISLLDILEQLNLTGTIEQGKVALIPVSAELVCLWARSDLDNPESAKGRLSIIGPDEEEIDHIYFEIKLQEHQRLRTRNQLVGIPIKQTGVQTMRVSIQHTGSDDWTDVARIPLDVRMETPTEAKGIN